MMPRSFPAGADAITSQRMMRSFLVVRIVRGSVLLLFLAIAWVGVEVKDWPSGASVAITLAMLVQTGALVACCRRYLSAGKGFRRGMGA